MSQRRPSQPAARPTIGPWAGADREAIATARGELDAVVVRMSRLAQAGVLTGEHRKTLRTIAGELHTIRERLRSDAPPRFDAVIDALEQVVEHLDGMAGTHQDCVYGPVLAQLAEQLTAAVKGLSS